MAKEIHRKSTREEQIEDFISTRFVGKPCSQNDLPDVLAFRELLREVLRQIWDKIGPELVKVESVHLVNTNTVYRIFIPPMPKKAELLGPDRWMIIFHGSLVRGLLLESVEWRRYVRYVIAHEFAHFFLGHEPSSKGDIEKSANILARMWGFPVPEATDPHEKRTVWALLDEMRESGENLAEVHKRLIEEGVIEEFQSPVQKSKGGDSR